MIFLLIHMAIQKQIILAARITLDLMAVVPAFMKMDYFVDFWSLIYD